jgi:transcription antitermination factor NusG
VAGQGYEVFRPLLRTKIGCRWTTVGLFPGYMFVRILAAWRAIDRTPGVFGLIKNGETPARCPYSEIGTLLARADRDGVIRLMRPPTSRFAPGDRVSVRGFDGIYLGMGARVRARVLLTTLGAQGPVEIAAHMIAARG